MAKRRKKLEKGISSIEKQIKLHEDKKDDAVEKGKLELARYYVKEIASLENAKEKKEKMRKKDG